VIVAATTGLSKLTLMPLVETPFAISCPAVFSLIMNDITKFLLVKKTETRRQHPVVCPDPKLLFLPE
jgi:hypothetical protein